MAKPKDRLSKWKSPLLLIVFSFLLFESLSGFLLFFFGQFLQSSTALATVHWVLGIAALLPYAIYQWQHYFAVRQYAAQLHYQIGLFSFLTICVVIVSGFPLVFDLNQSGTFYTVVDMVHIVSSFAFLILLSGHLVLVARVTLARLNKRVPAEVGALSLIGRKVLWLPITISVIALLLISFFSYYV